jgi:outer membrane protein assembly factor BamB
VASGRTASRFKSFLALLGLIAIPVTYGLVTGWNPLPGWLNRLSALHRLSQPAPAWTVSAGDGPTSAATAPGVVVVFEPGRVDVREAGTGQPAWTAEADWATAAGSARDGGSVVLLGTRRKGYRAVDPTTGRTRWSESGALGVWAYADLVVDITCPDPLACTLAGRAPATGKIRWRSGLVGAGHGFAGANRSRSGLRPLDGGFADSRSNLPEPAPALLGLRIDDQVQVFSARSGSHLRSYRTGPSEWAVVAGDRVLVTSATRRGSSCRFKVSAQDPASGREVWSRTGWDLGTTGELGCDQERGPVGGGGLVSVIAPDGRDALLRVETGGEVYRAPTGARILATDGEVIVIRLADHDTLRAVRGSGTTLWSRGASRHAQAGVAAGVVLIADPDSGRLAVLDGGGQVLVDAKTQASVLGYAEHGLVIASGRSVGLLPYGSLAP